MGRRFILSLVMARRLSFGWVQFMNFTDQNLSQVSYFPSNIPKGVGGVAPKETEPTS